MYVVYVACVFEMHNSVTAMYTYRRPLSWTPGQLARWRLVEAILKLFGKVVGINIFKRLLNFHETTIILISLTSIIAEAVIIGLADTSWKMYMAAGAATFGYFGLPTYKALVTQMVAADEVGKVMSAFGMGYELGVLLAIGVFNNIYSATVRHTPGAVFYMIGGLMTVCTIIMAGVHFMYKRDLAMEEKEPAAVEEGKTFLLKNESVRSRGIELCPFANGHIEVTSVTRKV